MPPLPGPRRDERLGEDLSAEDSAGPDVAVPATIDVVLDPLEIEEFDQVCRGVGHGSGFGVWESGFGEMRLWLNPESRLPTRFNLASNQRPPPTLTLSTTMVPVGRERGTLIFEAHVSTTYDRMPSLGLVYDIGISRKVTMTVPFRIDRQHGAAP